MVKKRNKANYEPSNDFSMNEEGNSDEKLEYSSNKMFGIKDKNLAKRKVFLSRARRRLFKHVWVARVFLIIIGICLLAILGFFGVNGLKGTTFGQYVGVGKNFIFPPSGLVPEIDGRINILLMGKSGEGQDSPDLTDTMILVSISQSDHKISLISIPRDIWIPDLQAKINSSYYWGKQKSQGSALAGIVLAKSTVEEIVGVPIQYGVVINFSGFQKVIDEIGGVDVMVDRGFTDTQYPLPGHEADNCNGDPTLACRYQTVTFKAGLNHMDGATALKFVRSRHAPGDEGSDLARAQRQQKVIKAIMEKTLSPATFLSPSKITSLVAILNSSVETDMAAAKAAVVGRYVVDARNNIVTHAVPEELLAEGPKSYLYGYQFVFLPKKGDWSDLQKWVKQNLP
ncbi:MAG TPA: LCP family protein [Patescibacteria group bacterium]